jgi:hypothetical protein
VLFSTGCSGENDLGERDPKRAETYSRLLVNMPYQDLNDRLHPEDRGLLG